MLFRNIIWRFIYNGDRTSILFKKDFKIGGGSLMNIEKLSLIEQAILTNKKKEIYQELCELACMIRRKQHDMELKLRIGILSNEDENAVKDF